MTAQMPEHMRARLFVIDLREKLAPQIEKWQEQETRIVEKQAEVANFALMLKSAGPKAIKFVEEMDTPALVTKEELDEHAALAAKIIDQCQSLLVWLQRADEHKGDAK